MPSKKTLTVISDRIAVRNDSVAVCFRTLDPARMDAFLYRVSKWPGWKVVDLRKTS